jgi:PKD repeat protein
VTRSPSTTTSARESAGGSSDPDGTIASYAWNFGDGTTGTGQRTTKVYSSAGNFTVTLEVSDGKKSATASGSVTIRNLNGTWRGTILGFFPFSFNLTQSGSAISGTYFDEDGPGTVTGSVSAPLAVRLTVIQPGFPLFTFTGTTDAAINVITGTVTVEGFAFPFTMSR